MCVLDCQSKSNISLFVLLLRLFPFGPLELFVPLLRSFDIPTGL